LAEAVRVRQEIDLRIGASFTRFQTLTFRDILLGFGQVQPTQIISYGPCQFPTLGFIVDRYKQLRDFVPEEFWSVNLKYQAKGKPIKGKGKEDGEATTRGDTIEFEWARHRVYDKLACVILFEKCQDGGKAKVTDVVKAKKFRGRPNPLNTIEAQKLISRKLRIASAQAMDIMEKLYQRGILSYPRTETNCFNPTINLRAIVDQLRHNQEFGDFADRVAAGTLWGGPKNGKQDDKAHPPIHPVKNANKGDAGMSADEWRVYELISRHFLATISKDAVGSETKVTVALGGEIFTAKGLIIEELNWLEVFHYEKWSDTDLPPIQKGEEFTPDLKMVEGKTSPPNLLSEADLIAKMDATGIGTDATIHEHIKTVLERSYAVKQNQTFIPTTVGVSLVEAYEHVGIELYKPYLRAQMENDMKLIGQGTKSKDVVLRDCISEMSRIFKRVYENKDKLSQFIVSQLDTQKVKRQYPAISGGGVSEPRQDIQNKDGLSSQGPTGNTEFAQCPQCKKSALKVKTSKAGSVFIACTGFPECKNTMSLPKALESITMTDDVCQECLKRDKKKVFKFRLEFITDFVNDVMNQVLPDDDNTSGTFCVMAGCDPKFKLLVDSTYQFQNKRTYDGAFKNQQAVPNFYH